MYLILFFAEILQIPFFFVVVVVFFLGHFGRRTHPPQRWHLSCLRCSSARNKVVWLIVKIGLCVANNTI